MTVQPIVWGFASYQFALLGMVEATLVRNDEKNRLCPPIPYWDTNADYLRVYLATMAGEQARGAHPALAAWAKQTRLHPFSALGEHRDHPTVGETRERIKRFAAAAVGNIEKLLSTGG